jgi:hypothetical protein
LKKVIIIEDIESVVENLKERLLNYDVQSFLNGQSFLALFRNENFKNFLNDVDYFILDFNLGDSTLMTSNIYEIILKNKKKSSVLICISSYGQFIVDKNCELVSKMYGRENSFDFYLPKIPIEVENLILALDI